MRVVVAVVCGNSSRDSRATIVKILVSVVYVCSDTASSGANDEKST